MKNSLILCQYFLLIILSISYNKLQAYDVLLNNLPSKKQILKNNRNPIFQDSVKLNRVLDKLFTLREVKEKNKFIDSLTGHAKGISMRVIKYPTTQDKYYYIAVGYDNDLRFETYFNFYVWPEHMQIKYLDPLTGKALTLEQWRKISKE